ncbi:hypothetical protein FQN60_017967 [Etheostoma spectabile]|uniref:UDP-glucuronosyltransferase n=1 Tax=Etheostoma spectabile TaxID=54343 RepID=A0A5J5DGQ5_9PERO|nr:hypothetical protein FQN60_017967 [Etheostoma spectabile]
MSGLRLVTLVALLCSLPTADGGKVLVFPVEGSHWVNMKVLIQELHSRGHHITVIRPKTSMFIRAESLHYESSSLDWKEFEADFMNNFTTRTLQLRREFHTSTAAYFKAREELMMMMHHAHKTVVNQMQDMFEDAKLMQLFQEAKYDVVLTDPCFGGGVLLAHQLGLPLVFNVRWTIMEDGHHTVAPSPLSYVPIPGLKLTDKMTFWQRVLNVLLSLMVRNNYRTIKESYYTPFVHRHFGPNVHYDELVQAADIWLMRTDFTFEFPRPTMPNVDDNLFRMSVRGIAKVLEIGTLNKDNFLEAVKAVLYEPSYRENVQQLSRLHRDQPMKPLDRAMFWIEFVMRHKGAAHLRTNSYKMSWIQYHSIDVIALLVVLVMMMSLICILTVKCLWCKVCGGRKAKLD